MLLVLNGLVNVHWCLVDWRSLGMWIILKWRLFEAMGCLRCVRRGGNVLLGIFVGFGGEWRRERIRKLQKNGVFLHRTSLSSSLFARARMSPLKRTRPLLGVWCWPEACQLEWAWSRLSEQASGSVRSSGWLPARADPSAARNWLYEEKLGFWRIFF